MRHLQSHSGLLFDVFQDFDPENLLFRQAYDELLDQQMEWTRLRRVLERMRQKRVYSSEQIIQHRFHFHWSSIGCAENEFGAARGQN